MKRPSHLIILAISLAGMLCGCQTQPPGSAAGAFAPLSREQLIEKINANNERIPTLWARTSFDAEIHDTQSGKTTRVYADDGYFQYRAPDEISIRASKVGVGLVLDVGLNHERFWLAALAPGPDTMWWGYTRSSMVKSEIPIRPQDVLQILAISPISSSGPDVPGLSFDARKNASILSWYRRTPGGFGVIRQIAYDSEAMPRHVRVFDADGHLAMQAELSKHRNVEGASADAKVATNYDVYLPASRSSMVLRLRGMQISHGTAPNDASFKYPEKPPVAKVIRVDAQVSK